MSHVALHKEPAQTRRLSARAAVALQILPGLPAFAAYLAFAAWTGRRGLPPVFALYLAILFAEVPATWATMAVLARRRDGRVRPAELFPWSRPLRPWQYLVFGLPLAIGSLALMIGLQGIVAEPLRTSLFAWVPEWAVMDMTGGLDGLSRSALLALWVLGLVSATLIGGVTQELYARGFLLPRMAHLGAAAPVLNAAAFAVMHLISPWSWPVFFIVSLLWSVAVYRTRSIQLGLIGHVGMLAIMWLGMTALVFGGE